MAASGFRSLGAHAMSRRLRIRGRMHPWRLFGYVMLLLLAIGAVQVVASILFYEAIDRSSIRDDHARRVAEMLVVSNRLHARDPALLSSTMTTAHLGVTRSARPAISRPGRQAAVEEVRRSLLAWEPELAARPLILEIMPGRAGRRDLAGSMRLADGTWLNFRSPDISSRWPIVLRATMMTLLITLLCAAAAILVLRRLTAPLLRLSEAASSAARGVPMSLPERGPGDVRSLTRSFNDLQARISGLQQDQARSFEAISHDLRTPLSRLKVASDFVSDSDVARIVNSSADEMEGLLDSLQTFLRAQHLESEPEPVDIAAELRSLAADFGDRAIVDAPDRAVIVTHREPLFLALRPLVENAVQYGGTARITLAPDHRPWQIAIIDTGPGIPEDYRERVLDPFFRLDNARARDTPGFGLGIPTANALLTRFGGALAFTGAAAGGLAVHVTLPRAGCAT